jgi:hypothetical protein
MEKGLEQKNRSSPWFCSTTKKKQRRTC